MSIRTTTPAPHAGETEAPATPKPGQTPGMGTPPQQPTRSREDDERPQADPEVPPLGEWDKRRGPEPVAEEEAEEQIEDDDRFQATDN
jgi:hypothetical protein